MKLLSLRIFRGQITTSLRTGSTFVISDDHVFPYYLAFRGATLSSLVHISVQKNDFAVFIRHFVSKHPHSSLQSQTARSGFTTQPHLSATPAAFSVFKKLKCVLLCQTWGQSHFCGMDVIRTSFWLGLVLSCQPSDTQTCHNTTLRASTSTFLL